MSGYRAYGRGALRNHNKRGSSISSNSSESGTEAKNAEEFSNAESLLASSDNLLNSLKLTLIRGISPKPPSGSIRNFQFPELTKGIKCLGIQGFNSIQLAAIPQILNQKDCILLGAAKSGKTLAYLIPVCDLLLRLTEKERRRIHTPETNPIEEISRAFDKNRPRGPICLIVCSDSTSAHRIGDHLDKLLSGINTKPTYAYVCDWSKENFEKINEGLDIIITKITFVNELLQNPEYMFYELSRLTTLVIENVEVLCSGYSNQLQALLELVDNAASHQHKTQRKLLNRIYCGQQWNSSLEKFYYDLKPVIWSNIDGYAPCVMINSTYQILKYTKIKWYLFHTTEDQKFAKLKSLLETSTLLKHKRLLIVCNTLEKCTELYKRLKGAFMMLDIVEAQPFCNEQFKSEKYQVIVAYDKILRTLFIDDISCIVHYDSYVEEDPNSKDKLAIGKDRFSCMWSLYRNIAKEKTSTDDYSCVDLESILFLTGSERNLHKIKKFTSRFNAKFPESLERATLELEEEDYRNTCICLDLKLFGRCMEPVPEKCKFRHEFLIEELERPTTVPRSGEVEVQIAECLTPNRYTGRIIRWTQHQGKATKHCSKIMKYAELKKTLNDVLENPDNLVPLKSFAPDTLCAVYWMQEWFRARILNIVSRNSMGFPDRLKLYCVDTGTFCHVTADCIFEIPEALREQAHFAVELILCNIQPPFNDKEFSYLALRRAKDLTSHAEAILNARIRFAIEDTVWVDQLVERKLDKNDKYFVNMSVKLDLLSQKLIGNNISHLENLMKTVKQTGFFCSEMEQKYSILEDASIMNQFFSSGDTYHWAFLIPSTDEKPVVESINITFTDNPYRIYGTLDKFWKSKEDLENELDSFVNDLISTKCQNYETQFRHSYHVDLVVCVKDLAVNQCWVRGLIISKTEETYDVLLVDSGYVQKNVTPKELFLIPSSFVDRLPFQAVCLSLQHIIPLEDAWGSDTLSKCMDLTIGKEDDGLLLDTIVLEESFNEFPGKSYNVLLLPSKFDDNTGGDEVGEILVNASLAKYSATGKEKVDKWKTRMLAIYNQEFNKLSKCGVELQEDDSDYSAGEELLAEDFDVIGYDEDSEIHQYITDALTSLSESAQNERTGQNSSKVEITRTKNQEVKTSRKEVKCKIDGSHYPETATGFSTLRHPNVYWKQTEEFIDLRIEYPGIVDYTLEVENECVKFRVTKVEEANDSVPESTSSKLPKAIGFDLETFGKVRKNYQRLYLGQNLKIRLSKLSKFWWKHLLRTKTVIRWLKPEPEYSDSDDSSAEDTSMAGATGVDIDCYPDEEEWSSDDCDSEVKEDVVLDIFKQNENCD